MSNTSATKTLGMLVLVALATTLAAPPALAEPDVGKAPEFACRHLPHMLPTGPVDPDDVGAGEMDRYVGGIGYLKSWCEERL